MPRKTTPTISNAAEEFITQRFNRARSKGVRYGYASLLARFARHVGDCHVSSLTPAHVEDFVYGASGLHLTCQRNTLGKYRNDLKQFFDFCHRRDWLSRSGDAMVGGLPDKSTRSNRDRFRLTAREVLDLMEHASEPRDRALLAFVANTGVRISEALEMRVRDVNLQRGEMYVRLVKLGGVEVTYPITSDLDRELRSWLATYSQEVGVPFDRTTMFRLFPAHVRPEYVKGGYRQQDTALNPMGKINNPRTIIQGMAERAGFELEHGDGWHTIRRSVARIFFDQASAQGHDAALRMTQALLQHKNSATTEGYLGLDLEKRKVSEVLKGKSFLTIEDEDIATVTPIESAR